MRYNGGQVDRAASGGFITARFVQFLTFRLKLRADMTGWLSKIKHDMRGLATAIHEEHCLMQRGNAKDKEKIT